MPKFSLTLGLSLYGFGLIVLTLLDVFSASPSVNPDGFGYRLTDSFTQTSLNNRVLFTPTFRLVPGESVTSLTGRIRKTFTLNRNVHAVAYGHASVAPEGWVYFRLTNATKTTKEVVLSMPQHRCARATLFLERAGPRLVGPIMANQLDSIATLMRSTPLADRFFLSYRYAFPITLPPGQLTGVLLRTNAYIDYHEFDLKLSDRRVFLEEAIGDIIREWMVIFTCLIIGIISLVIGFTTPSPLMSTFGLMMLTVMLQIAFFYGYLGPLPYPKSTSFTSNTIATNTRLLLVIAAQLFIYQAIKPAIRELRWYKPVMWTLIGVCSVCILLHLLPPHFHAYFNLPVNRIMNSVSLVNLIWIGYFSLVAYRRAGIVYIGLFFLMLIGDVVVKQLSELIQGNEIALLKYPAQHPLLLIAMLTYLIASQFRRELVTKQRLQKQVSTTQQNMDTLRREEIDRIGRDLHDQVGNTLASALGYITNDRADAEKPQELIRDAITELRFLSHNLVKDDNRPLTEKMETLVNRFNDFSPVQFIFQDYTEKMANALPPLQQQSIYSILQELLTNTVRHSGASVAYVQFFCDEQTIEVAVEDDGVGFDLTTAQNTGIGMQNMFKRAALAQIRLRFDPVPSGTSVFLSIPRDPQLANT
ncbi:ATP-binding protein [Fibrella aquatica]|uniref:ATP-binding protein n=1 Tax=Fibrella aquatica TaxID=3242487 RepID=UPI003521D85B